MVRLISILFSYERRNYASGVGVIGQPAAIIVPPEKPVEPEPPVLPPVLPPGGGGEVTSSLPTTTVAEFESRDLKFSDFLFSQETGSLNVNGDSVTARNDYGVTIALPKDRALEKTDKIVLNITVDQKLQAYLFSYDGSERFV
jgi:hypothetical protein